MIRFLRQMAALPFTVTGFWLTSVGDIVSDVAYKIEGNGTPISDREALRVAEEVPDGHPTAA
jgi:hypothetical protein